MGGADVIRVEAALEKEDSHAAVSKWERKEGGSMEWEREMRSVIIVEREGRVFNWSMDWVVEVVKGGVEWRRRVRISMAMVIGGKQSGWWQETMRKVLMIWIMLSPMWEEMGRSWSSSSWRSLEG